MSVRLTNEWDIEVGVSVKKEDWENVKAELSGISKAFQEGFDRVSEVTWDEFKEYSVATSKDVSKTWESTTKDMKSLAAKSMWGTVSAWFEDDMDQVEDIWDNAWDSMITKADKAWDGFLNRAAGRLQRLLPNHKGPEDFPGALSFRLAA